MVWKKKGEKNEGLIYLWFEVGKLRCYLDSIIAPLRITVLHVCITSVARAGASVVHIWTCYSQGHKKTFEQTENIDILPLNYIIRQTNVAELCNAQFSQHMFREVHWFSDSSVHLTTD